MKVKVAESWAELNAWQMQEISHLFINASAEDFPEAFQKMVLVLFQEKKGLSGKIRLYRILKKATMDQLAPFAEFLLKTTNFYTFPEVSGLIKPADRLANLTAEHFSTADKLYDDYYRRKDKASLLRFVSSLYCFESGFDKMRLPEVAVIMARQPVKLHEQIALVYQFCRMYIWNSYPVIFPPKKEEEEEEKRPVFSKKQAYQSFDKVILGLVFSEEQPLGTKKEADATLLYEFLNVLTESILRHREKEKQYAKRN